MNPHSEKPERVSSLVRVLLNGKQAVVLTEDLDIEKDSGILFAGEKSVILFGKKGEDLSCLFSFSYSASDFSAGLADALRSSGIRNIFVLYNGVEQMYRVEELPKIRPIEAPRFLARRLEIAFPNIPYAACIERGVFSEPQQYLCVACPQDEKLEIVLKALRMAEIEAGCFGVLPVEAVELVKCLQESLLNRVVSRWTVMLCRLATGGLRQIIVRDGDLVLTRITPVPEDITALHGADDLVHEFEKTLGYLSRFGYTPEQGLDIVILCGAEEKAIIEERKFPVENLRCVTLREALEIIGMNTASGMPSQPNDAIFAAWILKKRAVKLPLPVAGFCPPEAKPNMQQSSGLSYWHGEIVPASDLDVVEWLLKRAVLGNMDAEFVLGMMHAEGQGIPKNSDAALEYYLSAGEKGHAHAQYLAATLLLIEKKDAPEAAKWMLRAAEQGLVEAQNSFGFMNQQGLGVAKSDEKAFSWYQKAAVQGYAAAQYSLGGMYGHGLGVTKDEAEGYNWYKKAAAQGHVGAQKILGG